MEAQIVENIPVVSATKGEIPWYIVYADGREMTFDCSKKLIGHNDPTRVEMGRESYAGFQFHRIPTCRFVIGKKTMEVTGEPIESSPQYFLNAELMDLKCFLAFAKSDLEASRFELIKRELEYQEASKWAAILVFWMKMGGGKVWRQIRFDPKSMVALDKKRKPVLIIKTLKDNDPIG